MIPEPTRLKAGAKPAEILEAIARDGARWAERAGSARADVLRRLERWEAALEGYRAIAAMESGTQRVHRARCWIGPGAT